MYWYAKLIIGLFIAFIIGLLLFVFRSHLHPPAWFGAKRPAPPPEQVVAPPDGGAVTAPPVDEHTRAGREKLALARRHVARDERLAARRIAENVLADPQLKTYCELWYKAVTLLSDINTTLLFSTAPCPEKETYTVVSGDSLWTIARKLKTTVGMVQRGNGLSETNPNIYPGQELSVYRADWNIRVSKSQRFLQLRDGARIVKGYRVGIGRQERTPEGTFVVHNKQTEPAWTPPGKHIPYGDPENVLGTRWLGLKGVGKAVAGLSGYGIHGTWEPETIGKAASNGCIRMNNRDVEELYAIVPEGTSVVIEE